MQLFRKILVPTDFSVHAEQAAHVAVDLSRRYDAPLTFLHIFEPVAYALPDDYLIFTAEQQQRLFASLEARLGELSSQARAEGAVVAGHRLLQGVAPREIVQLAAEDGFDLIVMGTHGRTGLKHLLVGSVAERVVRLAPCPVLTVRRPDVR